MAAKLGRKITCVCAEVKIEALAIMRPSSVITMVARLPDANPAGRSSRAASSQLSQRVNKSSAVSSSAIDSSEAAFYIAVREIIKS